MNNIFHQLEELLKKDERFVSKDGKIMRNAVYEASNKMDEKLLTLLLSNDDIKNTFFKKVKGTLIFDKTEFGFVINNRELLPDSYTRFKQKIGLIDKNNEFITAKDEVILSFPFKDCVLEFDSTDPNQDRSEIYFNETLAHDQIDNLFDNKVITNAKLIDKKGEKKIEKFDKNSNLLIKGNNLLVMHSLLLQYEGQVKLIYWDVLYNTESDKVPYADRFKHSSWLTMMKNRLEVAKRLLRDDGVICIQCDKNEDAYLKVLLDEIYGRNNYVNNIAVLSSTPSGIKTAYRDKTIIKTKDTIYVYKKNTITINPQYKEVDEFDTHFNLYFDRVNNKVYSLKEIVCKNGIYDSNVSIKDYSLKNNRFKEFVYNNSANIFQTGKSMPEKIRNISLKKVNIPIKYNSENDTQYAYNGRRMSFLSNSMHKMSEFEDGYKISTLICDFWDDVPFNNSQNEGSISLVGGKKPEFLVNRIISMFTIKDDLILDAYFGSGTTGAVAMKMGRKFIGIEQLDSHIELAKTRLKNVINGDETGISKQVGWTGGGSFTYFELKKLNYELIDKISKVKSKKELCDIADEVLKSDFLSYNVDPKKVVGEFKVDNTQYLEIDDIKKILIEVLDKNQLYVNYSDIDDKEFKINDADKKFTKSFYGAK